jgi:hypothetical protein
MLQCGHGFSAVEMLHTDSPSRPAGVASMWPRLFSRGDTKLSVYGPTGSYALQCGHGFSAVEMLTQATSVSEAKIASMWPRLFSRGDAELERLDARAANIASMWPRLFSRGDFPS